MRGEIDMSWLKKAIVGVSVVSLAAPIVANGTVGTAIAATSGNSAKTEKVAKPNSSYKVPLRDANSLFNLQLDKQKDGGYVLVTNIVASGNNVIQKGEQLVVNLSKQNVDLVNSHVINQDGSLPYTVKKDVDKGTVTFTFNKDVDSGNYQTAVGLATKNIYSTTSVKANFEGSPIKIQNNKITSKWQPQTATSSTSSTNSTSSTVAQQGTNSYTSQSAVTQAASTTSSSTASTTYTTTSTTASQQAGTTTTQTQADENSTYAPTFDEAEDAVMSRTNISVAGDASNSTETSANKATTDNGSSAVEANNALPDQASTSTSSAAQATTDNDSTDAQAEKADSDTQASPATTGNTSQATSEKAATTNSDESATATKAGQSAATTVEQPASVVQADSTSTNVIQTPNGKASDPEVTLNQVLENTDTDPNNADNTGDDTQSYQQNSTFEGIRKDIENKVPTASAEEQAEIVKTMPWIWSYISNSADQNQVFNFATLLTTGRTAYTTINGVADANSSNILQQQMPSLLKAFGQNMKADAFDKAMDIDVLLESQVYQDYLDGKYTASSDKLNASDAWSAMNDHITVQKVDDSTDTTGATKLENRYYNAKATLDGLVAAQVAKKQAEQADQLVVNKDESENQADDQTPAATNEASNSTGSKLFTQMKNDIDYKMSGSSEQDRAAVLGALPGILNDVSSKTASSDTTGIVAKYLQPTADGNSYLITLDT